MSDKSRRFRLRATLTAAAALLVGVGVAQAVPTSAAGTDAVIATSGQFKAAANVLPASDWAGCTTGSYGWLDPYRESQVQVRQINQAFDYKMFVLESKGRIMYEEYKPAEGTAVGGTLWFKNLRQGDLKESGDGWEYTARIYSVNRETGEFSDDWVGWKLKRPSLSRITCEGSQLSGTNPPPNTIIPSGSSALRAMAAPILDAATDSAELPMTEADSAPISAPSSTTQETTQETTPSPTVPSTTPPSATPEATPTGDPKPELFDTVESDGMTAGWNAGRTKVIVVDANGDELASGRAEKGSTLHWVDGQLWIIGDTQNYRIMNAPHVGEWRFFSDAGELPPSLSGK